MGSSVIGDGFNFLKNKNKEVKILSKKGLALHGWSPEHDMIKTVPEGFTVKGVSTYYKDGYVKGQWVKSKQDPTALKAYYDGLLAGLRDKIKPVDLVVAPPVLNVDLASCYIITDYHLGMLAWGEESGQDWDLKIAEDLLVAWFSAAIDSSPASEVAILAQLGDFLHFDGQRAVTPVTGHILDADSRFTKIVRVAIRVIRKIVKMLLLKHGRVHILMEEGNHDEASSVWLRELLSALYECEPRVYVDTRPDPYHLFRWGECFIGFHHGHKVKPAQVTPAIVAKFRKDFGETSYHYVHMGHMHHNLSIENTLMMVEQHRTLATKDAYSSKLGFSSGRDAKVIVYHRKYGEVSRITITPEMLKR
jgi:hypothetical protein